MTRVSDTSQDYKNTLAKQGDLNWDGEVFAEEKQNPGRKDKQRKQKKRNHKSSLCQAQN